jgi:DNA-binding response OmpR family regulator
MQSANTPNITDDSIAGADPGEKARVAVLEDDPAMRNLLKRLLEPEFKLWFAASGTQLGDAVQQGTIDLILLDILLPGEDGISIAKTLRARSEIPIILLSGLTSSETITTGLNVGADDYVTKPFQATVLRARMRNVLRRARHNVPVRMNQAQSITVRDVKIDLWTRIAANAAGQSTSLTEKELQILMALARKPGSVVDRDTLSLLVSGQEWSPINRSLDVHISHLRKKLGSLSGDTKLITSSRGVGYALRVN